MSNKKIDVVLDWFQTLKKMKGNERIVLTTYKDGKPNTKTVTR